MTAPEQHQESRGSTHVVFLCTGNAARSVMAATIAAAMNVDGIDISGAGTHSIEGQPMSLRTRTALRNLSLENPGHRSHQLTADDTERADVIVAFEPGNVAYVRRKHPDAAARTATIGWLDDHLGGGTASLAERLSALDLAAVPIEAFNEVIDPAGGEQHDFDECIVEVHALVRSLVPRLGPNGAPGSNGAPGPNGAPSPAPAPGP